ncbi:DarT ssDNA thymidine ADP-ribosyltransferase family protein [Bacillus sp. S14(2024)]|uniref:DarT ssDNA thymidine ADP-ribosyltransferase family protein n=1 Tax=Bacillus sp. S14(2024) TaxID=3162884 RepID=UPI003D1F71AD
MEQGLLHVNHSSVIASKTSFLPSNLKYLTQYAYHFSNITNIANILTDGKLYCRNHENLKSRTVHDNASPEVINCTNEAVKDYVRFYFRPKTPTQYRNEGILSEDTINSGLHAHCPIPVFMVFDINTILNKPNAYFSHESLASHYNVDIFNTPQDLYNAPFHHIYHFNYINDEEDKQLIIKRRHAEILVKEECNLSGLKHIYCRNQAELSTLKSLLPPQILKLYSKIISIPENPNDFFNNEYLQVKKVYLDNKNDLFIEWINPRSETFKFKNEIYSVTTDHRLISQGSCDKYNPYIQMNENMYWTTSQHLRNHSKFLIKIYLDNNLVYQNIHTSSLKSATV